MQQMGLNFARKGRGGARVGAGRKPLPLGLRRTPHRARAEHRARHPLHITLRAGTRSLRSQQVVRTILGALRAANTSCFRIAQYSVQENHLHLIVEAESKQALSSALRGLMIRLAMRVNRLLFRRGRFWADRWHGNALTSPRQVRNALVYVLKNRHKHAGSAAHATRAHAGSAAHATQAHAGSAAHAAPPARWLDPLSSAQWFDGFAAPIPIAFRSLGPISIVSPVSWLLRLGWRRHGLIESNEVPKA